MTSMKKIRTHMEPNVGRRPYTRRVGGLTGNVDAHVSNGRGAAACRRHHNAHLRRVQSLTRAAHGHLPVILEKEALPACAPETKGAASACLLRFAGRMACSSCYRRMALAQLQRDAQPVLNSGCASRSLCRCTCSGGSRAQEQAIAREPASLRAHSCRRIRRVRMLREYAR
jgi:hypothetical protein